MRPLAETRARSALWGRTHRLAPPEGKSLFCDDVGLAPTSLRSTVMRSDPRGDQLPNS